MNLDKQKQIEAFLIDNKIDILACQEINIDQETFSQCSSIMRNFTIIENNAINYVTPSYLPLIL